MSTAFLTNKGRVLADALVSRACHRDGGDVDEYLLDCSESTMPNLKRHVMVHKLRAKVGNRFSIQWKCRSLFLFPFFLYWTVANVNANHEVKVEIQDRSDELGVVAAGFSATNGSDSVFPSSARTRLCASEEVKDALVSCYQDPRHTTLGLRGIVSLDCCRLLDCDDETGATYEAARYMQASLISLGWEEGVISY